VGDISEHPFVLLPSDKSGPFPVVILVHGSGINDMDESLPESESGYPGGTKFFLPIAYYLPTRGFAVVRYNKRGAIGIGPQTSPDPKLLNPPKADTQYSMDADFVLKQTLINPLIDPKRVIMLGHSEGTLNVSHVATSPDGKDVAGVILMGVQGYDIKIALQYQLVDKYILSLQAADSNHDGKMSVEEFQAWLTDQTGAVKQQAGTLYSNNKFIAAVDQNGDNMLELEGELRPLLQAQSGITNFPKVTGFSPDVLADWEQNGSVTTVLPTYKGPVLMLNGEADIQTVVQGARDADAALTKAGNPDHKLITYPGLGQSFYPAKGLDQPLGPPQTQVLQDMGDWLTQHFNK
jgi:pimeloyl-ACP methyl ester carboxylesterase